MRDRAVCLLICPLTWSGWDGRQRQHRRSNNDKSKRIVYNKGVKKTKWKKERREKEKKGREGKKDASRADGKKRQSERVQRGREGGRVDVESGLV